MQPFEDSVQPRDRRPWTEEEDEKLRAAIEEGSDETSTPLLHYTHVTVMQRTQILIPLQDGMLLLSTFLTEPTRTVGKDGGRRWLQ